MSDAEPFVEGCGNCVCARPSPFRRSGMAMLCHFNPQAVPTKGDHWCRQWEQKPEVVEKVEPKAAAPKPKSRPNARARRSRAAKQPKPPADDEPGANATATRREVTGSDTSAVA